MQLAQPMEVARLRLPLWRRPECWLVVVAVAHALSPLLVLGVHWAFGADETVYLSQLNRHVPPQYFSAPRARGATFLAAPVTLLTSSVAAVRVWVAALSGVALWLAFRPWLRVVGGWVVPTAALAYAGLWTVTLYGFEVMPNEWVAFATVGACGVLLRWFAEGRRRHLVVVGTALAVVALLRPSDAAYAAAGLGLGALVARVPWRAWWWTVLALVAGTLAGVAEWIVEAQTSFGGVGPRVTAAQAEQGGSGLYWAGGAQARVLAGPLLCRDGCTASAPLVYRLWWVVLGVLVVAAVVGVLVPRTTDPSSDRSAQRAARQVVVLPVVAGLVVAAQYLLTVPYGAPRFLLPAYALLAVPAMIGARGLVGAVPRRQPRAALSGALAVLLVASVVVQAIALVQRVRPELTSSAAQVSRQVRALRREGVRPGCVLIGGSGDSLQLSYALRCHNGPRTSLQVRDAIASGRQAVWTRHRRPPGRYGRHWERLLVPDLRDPPYVATPHPAVEVLWVGSRA